MNTRPLQPRHIVSALSTILATVKLHPKQFESLSHALIGATFAPQAGVAATGRAAAAARGTTPKHGIKQFDRFLTSERFPDEEVQRAHLAFVLGHRSRVVASLDWTEFPPDAQHQIALHLVTKHGRSTPLLHKTVRGEELAQQRAEHEDALLRQFRRLLPETVTTVIILADRGFADVALYDLLELELAFHFVIRFRKGIRVEDFTGDSRRGADWVPANGRARLLPRARVTRGRRELGAVVAVKRCRMKEPWLLATTLQEPAQKIVKLYGRRFTIEESFRDEKDPRFGVGHVKVHIGSPRRRDRMFLVEALVVTVLTLLGAAGERLGFDRLLRANTVTRRTHSLLRQGREYARGAIGKAGEAIEHLRAAFFKLVRDQPYVRATLGEI